MGTELDAFTAHIDATPLGRINQLAVDHLTLTVPSTLIDGDAPVVPLTLLDLRIRLLRRSTPSEVRDRAWRHIGQLARAERGDWNLFALGLAYPGLRARAWRLTEGLSFHRAAQVHFRLAGEFLFALHRLDLDKPNVASRLIGAAYDQATGRKKRAEPVIIGLNGDTLTAPDEIAYSRSEDSPRRVLDRLVSRTRSASDGQRITELHATLIARTYLDGDKLKQVAADLGMSESNASKHRTRAEALIARQLGRPGLVGQPLSAYLDLSQEDLRLRRELQRHWIWPQRTARDRLAPVLQRQHNPVVQLSNGPPRFGAVVVDLHAVLVQVIGADQHQAGERHEREGDAPVVEVPAVHEHPQSPRPGHLPHTLWWSHRHHHRGFPKCRLCLHRRRQPHLDGPGRDILAAAAARAARGMRQLRCQPLGHPLPAPGSLLQLLLPVGGVHPSRLPPSGPSLKRGHARLSAECQSS
ncbi:MAG TPA: hypothetical protein VF070_10890 [Streptosporangiaceae bacterium]